MTQHLFHTFWCPPSKTLQRLFKGLIVLLDTEKFSVSAMFSPFLFLAGSPHLFISPKICTASLKLYMQETLLKMWSTESQHSTVSVTAQNWALGNSVLDNHLPFYLLKTFLDVHVFATSPRPAPSLHQIFVQIRKRCLLWVGLMQHLPGGTGGQLECSCPILTGHLLLVLVNHSVAGMWASITRPCRRGEKK